jgi:hypothetical protein
MAADTLRAKAKSDLQVDHHLRDSGSRFQYANTGFLHPIEIMNVELTNLRGSLRPLVQSQNADDRIPASQSPSHDWPLAR